MATAESFAARQAMLKAELMHSGVRHCGDAIRAARGARHRPTELSDEQASTLNEGHSGKASKAKVPCAVKVKAKVPCAVKVKGHNGKGKGKADRFPKLNFMIRSAQRPATTAEWTRQHNKLKSETVRPDIGELNPDVPEDFELPRNDDPLFGVAP